MVATDSRATTLGVSQPGCRAGSRRASVNPVGGPILPTSGCRQVHLPGRGAGCVLPPRHRLGAGPHAGSCAGGISAHHGAASNGGPAASGVHHSDRGVQCRLARIPILLKQNGARIAADRARGKSITTTRLAGVRQTLKYEEVYRSENYRDLADAYARSASSAERVYNQQRLHSALSSCPACRSSSRTAGVFNDVASR